MNELNLSSWWIERLADGISGGIMFWLGYWMRGKYEASLKRLRQ